METRNDGSKVSGAAILFNKLHPNLLEVKLSKNLMRSMSANNTAVLSGDLTPDWHYQL